MSGGQGLLRDIIDHPGDDGLRRIYADWLDDDGQHDRAEFLRAQLDLAAMDDGDPRYFELRARELHLYAGSRYQWHGRVPGRGIEVRFTRGFPGDLTLDADAFLRHGEAMFESRPVTRLKLTGLGHDERTERVIDSPLLDRVAELDLTESGPSWPLLKLLQARPLSGLRTLRLSYLPIGTEGLSAVLRHPAVPRLRELHLSSIGIHGDAVEELCGRPDLGGLEVLDLSKNPRANLTLALAATQHLPALRRLRLAQNHLGPAGVRDLARSPRLRH
ncbi:MAG: TIGR02996 domain-containing protein, partial [Gemmataceae bacterium]